MSDLPRLADVSVAWIGLGRMGTAMATRLIRSGQVLSVWNRTPDKCEPLIELGATRLGGMADTARSDVIFSMVLDDSALDSLHDTTTGIFTGEPTSRRVSVWIDGSTVSPRAAERAARAAALLGVAYVSSPVSGNPGVVAAGNAVFAISGDHAGLDIAEEIGRVIGRDVQRVGSGAEANVIKLCTNALLAVTMQSLAETAVLADKSGVSRGDLMAFINGSAVGSSFTRYKTASLTQLDFTPTLSPRSQRKGIRLAIELAHEYETPMPLLNTTEVAFSRLVSGGLGDGRDYAALILDVARDAGHTLQPEEERR